MFRLQKIEFEGTFSIDKFEFDFTKNKGKTLVVGQNKDEFSTTERGAVDDATSTISNESGKTNFFDGIEEHFTGGTPKGLKNDGIINVFTNTGAMSRAEWSTYAHQYVTTKYRRYQQPDGKDLTAISIIQDGVDLTKRRTPDNKTVIQTYFPYDLSEFRSLVYVPASETYPLLLPDGQATAKRRLMNTIYQLHYEDLLKASRERKTEVERAIDALKERMSGEVESLKEQLDALEDAEQLQAELKALPESDIDELQSRIKALETRVQTLTSARQEIQAMLDRKHELGIIEDPVRERDELEIQIQTAREQVCTYNNQLEQLEQLHRLLVEKERYLHTIQSYVEHEDILFQALKIDRDIDISKYITECQAQYTANAELIPRHAERDMLRVQRAEIQQDNFTGSAESINKRITALERDLDVEQKCIDIYTQQKTFVLSHGIIFDPDFNEHESQNHLDELTDQLTEYQKDLASNEAHLVRAEQGECPTCGHPYDNVLDIPTLKADIKRLRGDIEQQRSRIKAYRDTSQSKRDALRAYQELPADEHGRIYQFLDPIKGSLLTPYELKLTELRGAHQKRQSLYDNLKYMLNQMRELERNEAALKNYADLDGRQSTQIQAENQKLKKTIETAEELKRVLTAHHQDYAKWSRLHVDSGESVEAAAHILECVRAKKCEINEFRAAIETIQQRLHLVSGFMERYKAQLGSALTDIPVDEIEAIQNDLSSLREQRDGFIAKRSHVISQLQYIERLQKAIAESQRKQIEIDALRRKQQIWTTLISVFGAAGLPKDKIQEIVHQINERIKVYTPIIFHKPRQIYFEVGDNGDILLRHTKRGHVMKSVSNSSGGRIKVTAAVLFALRDTLPPNKKSNLLILDEFDLNLDEIGALRILDALDVHIQRSHVENVLMTSHKTLLRKYKSQTGNPFWDQVLLATMENEITTYSLHT